MALPVAVAGFAERHVAVGVFITERMLLTAINILGPVTGVSILVVQQTTDAELFSGSAVPAGPVASAGSFVPEDTVQPVAMLRANWRVYLDFRVFTIVGSPGIIAAVGDSSMFAREDQPVGAVVLLRLSIVALPVLVAVFVICDNSRLGLARVFDLRA